MASVWGPAAGRVDRTLGEEDFEDFKRICMFGASWRVYR